jgi:ankyrin repeat protein
VQCECSWRATPLRILEAGAGVNAKDGEGNTSLLCAAGRGSAEILRLLRKKGAVANVRNGSCWTPWEVACEGGFEEASAALIDAQERRSEDIVSGDGRGALGHAGFSRASEPQ